MLILYSLMLALLPKLLVCVAVLVIALYHWRRHPNFKPVFDFRRQFWLALFISIGIIALGFSGLAITTTFFPLLHIPYKKLGVQDEICIAFVIMMVSGVVCCTLSSACCLWHLIIAIQSYARARSSRGNTSSKSI